MEVLMRDNKVIESFLKQTERKLKEMIMNHEVQMEKNITDRWTADMNSDSWLSKNVRPMVLIFLIVCTMLLIFINNSDRCLFWW